jgi:hypothetical protein
LIGAALLTISGCASSPTVSHSEPHGIVAMAIPQDSQNNYRVQVREIDGQLTVNVRNAYWLAPGRHTLRLSAILPDSRPMLRDFRDTDADRERYVLTIDVEEGKRYSIAAHRTGQRASEWEPVILEVTDIR